VEYEVREMHSLQIIGPRAVKRLSNSTSNARGNMLTRKSKLLLSLTVATPMLFAACVDNTLIGPYRDVAGTYDLTVFSGASLPVTYTYLSGQNSVVPNGGTITWTDGTMVLNSQGTFTERNNYDYQDNLGASGRQAFVSQGTFTLNGSDFTLSAPAQNNIAARFAQGTLIVSNNSRINYVEDNGNGTTSAYEYIM
jgi:predicted small secreted protein